MRLKDKEEKQRQWNKVLAYLYYIDHNSSFKKPFLEEYAEIIEFLEAGAISQEPRCMDTGCRGNSTALVLHHRDGNVWNASLENLAILCKSCNAKKYNWGPLGESSVAKHSLGERTKDKKKTRGYEVEVEGEKVLIRTYESLRNIECEERFKAWLDGLFPNGEEMRLKDVVNAGAEEVDSSQQTITRYIEKKTNPINGTYEIFKDESEIRMIRKRKI